METQDLKKMLDKRSLRMPFNELESLLSWLGWNLTKVDNADFPYQTIYFLLRPSCEDNVFVAHVNSDEIRKFCFACGYFDIHVDYTNKEIIVYA